MSNPIETFIATVVSGVTIAGSAFSTFTFNITAGFEAFVPVRILTTTNVSAAPEVYVYRSTDGGANFETEATIAAAFTRKSGGNQVKHINIPNGMYAIAILAGGPNGITALSETAMVITAYS